MERAAEVVRRGPVGWVVIGNVQDSVERSWEPEEYMDIHVALNHAFHELRFDPDVRVIGVTGAVDGEFYSVPRRARYDEEQRYRTRFDPEQWGKIGPGARAPRQGVPSAIESLVLMDKPVVARVNGDVIGFGQSVLWGCDIIIALAAAVISDVHMGQGDVIDGRNEVRGLPFAVAPGDGAMAFWPLYGSPPKIKEYQLLSRAWTARELADMHAINYAVSDLESLDAKVDEIISALLARPQFALRRTKILANKPIVEQWNLVQELAHSYERMDFADHARLGHMKGQWTPDPVEPPAGGWSPRTAAKTP